MTNNINIPNKQRKHAWVSEAISRNDMTVSVWPSPDDLKSEKRRERFLETIAKIGNDPRVIKIERHLHDVYSFVFVFHLQDT